MKFIACVTLYNPDKDVIKRINEYLFSFDKVIVYDNSSNNSSYIDDINENCIYLYNGSNDGLSIAFNEAIKIANENNADYLCTLDQDSIFYEKDITKIKNDIVNCNKKIGIMAPKIIYQNESQSTEVGISKTNWVICSGSFLNLSAINESNLRYDEYYFLDRFDQDICEAINRAGYDNYIDNEVYLYQELGYTYKGKSNHSYIRHYYIFRNRFYYNKKFYSFPTNIIRSSLQTFRHLILIILEEDKKLLKIKQLFFAAHDYLNNKGGKKY